MRRVTKHAQIEQVECAEGASLLPNYHFSSTSSTKFQHITPALTVVDFKDKTNGWITQLAVISTNAICADVSRRQVGVQANQ